MKILMVCLGNICRSPLAEGILKSKLSQDFIVDSAGTGNWHVGALPDKRSIEIAGKYGIDISQQRARQFKFQDFDEFDLIFVMDKSNYEDVIKLTKEKKYIAKVRIILDELEDMDLKDVPDPYYGTLEDFEKVYQLLDEATDNFVSKLVLN